MVLPRKNMFLAKSLSPFVPRDLFGELGRDGFVQQRVHRMLSGAPGFLWVVFLALRFGLCRFKNK